jgi:hypothetical protein
MPDERAERLRCHHSDVVAAPVHGLRDADERVHIAGGADRSEEKGFLIYGL